jgi:hypothetical protein
MFKLRLLHPAALFPSCTQISIDHNPEFQLNPILAHMSWGCPKWFPTDLGAPGRQVSGLAPSQLSREQDRIGHTIGVGRQCGSISWMRLAGWMTQGIWMTERWIYPSVSPTSPWPEQQGRNLSRGEKQPFKGKDVWKMHLKEMEGREWTFTYWKYTKCPSYALIYGHLVIKSPKPRSFCSKSLEHFCCKAGWIVGLSLTFSPILTKHNERIRKKSFFFPPGKEGLGNRTWRPALTIRSL